MSVGSRVPAKKPKVLIVDDHAQVVHQVAALLADDFDVAGTATDGEQALHAAHRVAPDLIVLDINMPGMNGFQTMRALEERGSRVPVVFLSTLDEEEAVSEAFRCGALGYVVKSRAARDLPHALEHARRGRVFAPSLSALFHLANGRGPAHAMPVYGDVETFLDGLTTVFEMALQRGDATCVIGTRYIRTGLERRLQGRGWNAGPAARERYLSIDVDAALERFMHDGLPDAKILADIAAELDDYRRSVNAGRLTVFGNLAPTLCARGNGDAAMALETHWESLTHALPFFTICGYATACFHGGRQDLWSAACEQHWAVSHTADRW